MVRKLRELKRDLRRAGFAEIPGRGKGDHSWWAHELAFGFPVNIDGHDGDDAHHYQERDVRAAIAAARKAEQDREQEEQG